MTSTQAFGTQIVRSEFQPIESVRPSLLCKTHRFATAGGGAHQPAPCALAAGQRDALPSALPLMNKTRHAGMIGCPFTGQEPRVKHARQNDAFVRMSACRWSIWTLLAALLLISSLPASGAETQGTQPATPEEVAALMQSNERRHAMITLSPSVESLLLEASHAKKIAFISEAMMKVDGDARFLIISLGVIPKFDKSWEGVINLIFLVSSRDNDRQAVFDLDVTLLSKDDLFRKLSRGYELPVGKGLNKLLEK